MRTQRRNQRRLVALMLGGAAIVGGLAAGPSFSIQRGGVDEQQPTVPRPSTTTIAPADDVLTTTAVPDPPTAVTN